MSLKWPEKMPINKNGRLSKEESDAAWATGIVRVMDVKMSCPQTRHITLFFDGTNNNDAEANELWRDSKKHTNTYVARLFNTARDEKEHGILRASCLVSAHLADQRTIRSLNKGAEGGAALALR